MPTADPSPDLPSRYAAVHERAMRDPEGFWLDAARAIDWTTRADPGLRRQVRPVYGRWFPDGGAATPAGTPSTGMSPAGRGDQVAI